MKNMLYVVIRCYKSTDNDYRLCEEIVGIYHSKEKAESVKIEYEALEEIDIFYDIRLHELR